MTLDRRHIIEVNKCPYVMPKDKFWKAKYAGSSLDEELMSPLCVIVSVK